MALIYLIIEESACDRVACYRTIIDIKDYKVCGFVNEDDGVESARGSVFAIKVDQFTAKHQFYESEYEGVNKVKINGKYCFLCKNMIK